MIKHIQKVLSRGLALALPLAVIIYILAKSFELLKLVVEPLSRRAGIDHLLGEVTLTVLVVFVMFLIILVLGLMMMLPMMERFRNSLEDFVVLFIPSLARMKTLAAQRIDLESAAHTWQPILLYVEEKYFPGFLVEESDEFAVINILMNQSLDESELCVMSRHHVRYAKITMKELSRCVRQFGQGMTELIRKHPMPEPLS